MDVENPILTGFNPDPSIVAVGDDFYIATSTFEWFPGVQIHHSKDLKNWRLLTRPLSRVSQLDLRGCQSSGGVWAPCLTYADGLFWLIFSNVRSHGGPLTDSPIYLVTAENIEGPWSEPTYMGANGFDPSMFHDHNGKKYLVNMQMGAIGSDKRFDGITLQEYCHTTQSLIGNRTKIWEGQIGITEGPHLYQKDGYYYLITAEGGTAWNHAISIARSKDILGPYEVDPANPMLTSANRSDVRLKTAGHGDFFQIPNGDWYCVHLCHRPIQKQGIPEKAYNEDKVCILGRETAIQRIQWPEGEFPRLLAGGNAPHDTFESPSLPEQKWDDVLFDDFNGPKLNPHFQTLREPHDESWLRLNYPAGCLSIKGRNSLFSCFEQSLIARRLQHFQAEAQTCIHFSPTNSKQEAGLIAYYDRVNYHYLRVTYAGPGKISIGVVTSDNTINWGDQIQTRGATEPMPQTDRIHLKMVNDHADLRFAWSVDGTSWNWIEQTFDSTNLGDWASTISNFTGTFWGLACQDTSGEEIWAEFEYFDYRPIHAPTQQKIAHTTANAELQTSAT